MSTLFEPFLLGSLRLRNRIVMAPMTRARSPDGVPNALNAQYYGQRAGAGLIVTEGTPISATAEGFVFIPGLYTPAQVAGWREVTRTVHERGGTIFAQLWHVGRVSHVSHQPGRAAPVSSTAQVARNSQAWGFLADSSAGPVEVSPPRALATGEVRAVIRDFAAASGRAIEAGFDGVELHGANGYLIEQFLNPLVNDRTDDYRSDTLENRTRFLLEAVDAVIATVGAQRTAIRLSPYGGLFDMGLYADVEPTYLHLAEALSRRNLAYVHLMDQQSRGSTPIPPGFLARFRQHYRGTLILAGGMTRDKAQRCIDEGLIDLAAFGEPFIANPDLVERLRHGWPLQAVDRSRSFGGGAQGYTDYPVYRAA